jgi:hypothetical protein
LQLPETFPSREGLTRAESRTLLGAALAVVNNHLKVSPIIS